MTVPDAILAAAVSLLKPYVPALTPEVLLTSLKPQTVKSALSGFEKPMTRKEAATLLQVSVMTIYRLLQSGKLRAAKIGRSVRIDPASIKALLAYGKRDFSDDTSLPKQMEEEVLGTIPAKSGL